MDHRSVMLAALSEYALNEISVDVLVDLSTFFALYDELFLHLEHHVHVSQPVCEKAEDLLLVIAVNLIVEEDGNLLRLHRKLAHLVQQLLTLDLVRHDAMQSEDLLHEVKLELCALFQHFADLFEKFLSLADLECDSGTLACGDQVV